jgi:hypothetical protein
LTPLQRVYLKQYLKSSYRSYLPNSKSRYTTLAAIVTNPSNGKDVKAGVIDLNVEPVLDDNRHITFDQRHYPIFRLNPGVAAKKLFWDETIARDAEVYRWFRVVIYEDQSIPYIWRPAWLGALLIFIHGLLALTALDIFAQQRYLKGEPLRGTRELLPKAYAREHRKQFGYGLTVYA